MKIIKIICLITLSTNFFLGCAVKYSIKTISVLGSESIIIILPSDLKEIITEKLIFDNESLLLKKIGVKKEENIYQGKNFNYPYGIKCGIEIPSGNIYIEKYRTTKFGGKLDFDKLSTKYILEKEEKVEKDKLIIKLKISKGKMQEAVGGFYGEKVEAPSFSEKEALNYIKNNSFIWIKTEIDSQYNTDSVYANFNRLLKSEILKEENAYKDPVTGKIYTTVFKLQIEKVIADVYISVFPYKNGSKAVISIKLPILFDENIGDLLKVITQAKEEIKKIIEA